MTALSRLRRRLGPPGTTPRAFFDLDTVRSLLELADACEAEETAECAKPPAGQAYDLLAWCPGYDHINTCPVTLARLNRLAALEKLRGLP